VIVSYQRLQEGAPSDVPFGPEKGDGCGSAARWAGFRMASLSEEVCDAGGILGVVWCGVV